MLAHRRPLEQLTPGEYAERFANELTVRHNRGDIFAKALAASFAKMYQERGLEPEHAAGVWVQEFGSPTPQPSKAPPKVKADQGMGRQNRSGEIDVVEEAMKRPVKLKKR